MSENFFPARPGLLLLDRFTHATEDRLADAFEVRRSYDPGFSLEKVASGIVAIATSGARGAPSTIVENLPSLRIVSIRGVGTDAIDLDLARRRGIVVTTTPNLLTDDVADLALALLLACARRLCQGDRFVREGLWRRGSALPLGRKVTGMRVGIVGLGRVGRAIAARLEAFRAAIRYTDVRAFDDVAYAFVPTVLDLATHCDALVLAASGGPRSLHIVDRAVLEALGPQGMLINVARGSLVDEKAMVDALVERRLGGAGLDVFADEPNVPSPLLALDQVVLQPHRASATEDTRLAMETLVVENLLAHFAGGPLIGVV
ncbi:MAG TPA: 2-hydroxyacid dehydrogenase [Acetobacteraceae bacterium]|nr:2-hydroxyacid dehydrogenase [Acetobacteraceae bacterium]